jgi:[protein-PII] uridylyltransferase
VSKLFALGCSVQQSSVRTLPKLGVYDWFQIRSLKTPAHILKQLDLIQNWTDVAAPEVRLQQIEVVKREGKEVILSFRGRDQKGVLLATAQALYDLGFTIRWAKVVTWGSQIDDVFSVESEKQIDQVLEILKLRFHVKKEASSQQIVT